MLIDFLKEVLFWCIPFVQKMIYKRGSFEDDIKVIPRVSEPVIFNLGSEIPTADIFLNAENKSQYYQRNF